MPLIFLVAVVPGWLQIVAADADARRGFFNGLLRRETLNALQQWVDDPDQVDEDWLLRLIERIGKGRFAQALAPSVSQDVCPAYIRSALEHIRDAIA